ncbi:MAG: TRAP transporter large permease [Lachnospiraceae bacterium]|nr:TRAP transporter large permease [Lachnospiraceae bacterium]
MGTLGTILVVGAVVFILIGVPVAYAMTSAGLMTLIAKGTSLMVFPQQMFKSCNSFPLMAILYFVVAGDLMMQGGISKRLIDMARIIFGWLRGALSIICFITCAFFGAISGSGLATSAAIGGIMFPEMTKNGDYENDYAAAILAVGGTLGLMIPPSIPLILYGTATDTSIGDLFLGVVFPGLLMMCVYLITSQIIILKKGYAKIPKKDPNAPVISGKEKMKKDLKTVLNGIPALLSPVIILGTIYGGVCTPTESAIIACIYSVIVGVFVYKELNWKTFKRAIINSAETSAVIMFLIAAAAFFGWAMTTINLTHKITDALMQFCTSKFMFLLVVNIFYLICGMLMETGTVILLAVPLLFPVAKAFGIDPVHFGVITNCNLAVGLFTPPFGTGVFLMAGKYNLSVTTVFKRCLPFILAAIIGLALITYVPGISGILL